MGGTVPADDFVFHDGSIFTAALTGDLAGLRQAAGPDGIFCLDLERSAAMVVFTGPDGFQQGNVYLPGLVLRLEIPRSFRVRSIDRVGRQFVVTSADGQTVQGTASQFGHPPRLIDDEHNPDYQQQLADLFRDTHLLPEHDACPPLNDPILGAIVHTGEFGHYAATIEQDDLTLAVSFDSADAELVTESTPRVRDLVTGITGLHDQARELIWTTGSDGTEPADVRAHFESVLQPTDLVVFRTGDFEICLEDDGSYLPDGYWIAVDYRADTTPVHAYLDC